MHSFAFRLARRGLVAAALLAGASEAHANGRYPAAGLIALDPADPQHLVLRATYGIVSTSDGGQTWQWMCEQSVGFTDNEDPMVAITKNGTTLAGTFKGLSVSADRGCNWAFVEGDLKGRFFIDLTTDPNAPEHALALSSNGIGGGKFETKVFESKDDAKTWAALGGALPEDFLGLSVDIAPSNAERLYATGRYGAPDYPGVIERSDDHGLTWKRLDIPGANDKHPPYLSAIDPSNPDKIYVRLDTADADELLVSTDGGTTWATAFKGVGGLLGFALSPDGTKVAVGGDKDGMWLAPADTLKFTKVSEVGVRCLKWAPDRLYACADEFKDGFHIGYSTNEGKTFTPFEHLAQICPLECPDGSSTHDTCPIQWGAVSLTIGAKCGGSDTSSSSSGSGGGTTTGGASGGGGGGCNTTGGTAAGSAILFAVAALSAATRKRRSRAQTSKPRRAE